MTWLQLVPLALAGTLILGGCAAVQTVLSTRDIPESLLASHKRLEEGDYKGALAAYDVFLQEHPDGHPSEPHARAIRDALAALVEARTELLRVRQDLVRVRNDIERVKQTDLLLERRRRPWSGRPYEQHF
jgi:hypothetical protein